MIWSFVDSCVGGLELRPIHNGHRRTGLWGSLNRLDIACIASAQGRFHRGGNEGHDKPFMGLMSGQRLMEEQPIQAMYGCQSVKPA